MTLLDLSTFWLLFSCEPELLCKDDGGTVARIDEDVVIEALGRKFDLLVL